MQALTSSQSAGAIIPAASAQTWNPSPAMQGFSPWPSPGLTFLSISAPAILTELTFLPFASGNFLSIDTISGPISSAQSGLWAFIGNPVTTTASTSTTTTGGGTTSVKLTKISSFTLGASSTGTASTAKLTIAFPTNMDQAAASIGRTVTYTTTAPGTTTTASSTASASGITLTNSITSTFPVSAGYTTQSVRPFTVTTTATFASGTTTQTSITLNSSNNTVTDTLQTAASPRYQFIEGAGPGQAGKGPGTIWLCGAAVLLYLTNSSTSSIAALNLAEVVIGGTFTTTSSTNSAGFPQYTFTGVASWQTSPIFWILTNDNRFNIPLTTATNFWLGLPPVLTPLQATNPAPARTFAGL